MKYGPFLKNFKLKNFKAVQNSGSVTFTPLTVLIGNNGSGKSSLVEGLETFRSIIVDGLDNAMQRWYGMDHVWNKRVRHNLIELGSVKRTRENPISFTLNGRSPEGPYRVKMVVNAKPAMNGLFIQQEYAKTPRWGELNRNEKGSIQDSFPREVTKYLKRFGQGESALPSEIRHVVGRWQFLNLLPDPMGRPVAKTMASNGRLMLNRDGSNLAQYLLDIRAKDAAAFDGIVEAMQFVLDYSRNFEPVETREIIPTMYLKMLEQFKDEKIEIPGWMISTGTIRILALLAVLRNPDPPPLIVMEEIENGLDPRTIHMMLDEIRTAVQTGQTQIIVTTHSPYLLDLLPLQTLVLVERENGGNPVFWRPSEASEVQKWAKSFAPGQLYTTGRFRREVKS